jgi:hypothetical protein
VLAYRTGITEKQLQGAPKYSSDNDWNWEDQTRTRGVNDYYGSSLPEVDFLTAKARF